MAFHSEEGGKIMVIVAKSTEEKFTTYRKGAITCFLVFWKP